jgi:hypothetical protein
VGAGAGTVRRRRVGGTADRRPHRPGRSAAPTRTGRGPDGTDEAPMGPDEDPMGPGPAGISVGVTFATCGWNRYTRHCGTDIGTRCHVGGGGSIKPTDAQWCATQFPAARRPQPIIVSARSLDIDYPQWKRVQDQHPTLEYCGIEPAGSGACVNLVLAFPPVGLNRTVRGKGPSVGGSCRLPDWLTASTRRNVSSTRRSPSAVLRGHEHHRLSAPGFR